MYQIFIIPYLYEAQHVSGDTPPIIRSLKLHWQPLVFYTWKVVGRVVGGRCHAHWAWQRPPTTRPTTFHVWKNRGCQCSFRLLMVGGVSPETCWASYKYGIINFDTLLHLVGFFFMNCTMMHGSTNIKCKYIRSVYVSAVSRKRRYHDTWRGLTLRRLMSYIYGAPILDVSRSHTTTQHSRPCRSPAEILGSNPTGGMEICQLWVSCVVR